MIHGIRVCPTHGRIHFDDHRPIGDPARPPCTPARSSPHFTDNQAALRSAADREPGSAPNRSRSPAVTASCASPTVVRGVGVRPGPYPLTRATLLGSLEIEGDVVGEFGPRSAQQRRPGYRGAAPGRRDRCQDCDVGRAEDRAPFLNPWNPQTLPATSPTCQRSRSSRRWRCI